MTSANWTSYYGAFLKQYSGWKKKKTCNHLIICVLELELPAHKTVDIIIAVIDFQVISHAGSVVFNIKLQKLEVNPLSILYSDMPVANLVIFILVWVAW